MEELKKSIQNRKTITFICDWCGQEGIKAESEYNRNLKKGRKNYCCRECAGKGAGRTRTGIPRESSTSETNIEHLKSICGNKRDEYTPFRYTLRNAKKRFKDFDLDLEFLKELWESQKGTCPYTGLPLTLPEKANLDTVPITRRASLDRINSEKGYVKGNVQFVSTPINYLKTTMTDLQTKQFLKEISSYTSTFVEDQTISSPLNEVSDTLAGY